MQLIQGQTAEFSRTITETDIQIFAGLSGDFNPVHVDKEYACNTFFQERIAHGLLTASFLSRLLGMHLPGPGSVYVSQTLFFTKPVYIGDTVTAQAEITDTKERERLVMIKTTCVNQKSHAVLKGEAVMKLPKKEVSAN